MARVSLCTQLTSEGPNPCMVHRVFFQFAATGETFSTFNADIRTFTSVHTHVKCQFTCHGESSPTHGAFVWFFSCVRASVYLQLAG